jgi:hypothetical protein
MKRILFYRSTLAPFFALASLLGLAVGCSSSSASSQDANLVSLQAALDGHPDAATQAAIKTLLTTLNAEEWGYLTYAQWPNDDGSAALTDPTLQKAAKALQLAAGSSAPQAFDPSNMLGLQSSGVAGQLHILSTLGLASSFPDWLLDYPEAVELMRQKNGLGYAATPGVAAEFARILGTDTKGLPLPNPTKSVDGVLDGCGKSIYGGGPTCSATDFCCKGVVYFGTGLSVCSDFTSCRGDATPPMLTGDDSSSDGTTPPTGDSPTSGDNPCFVGDGVTVNPAPWIAACENLSPDTPNPITCLDADPSLDLPGPTLSDGRNPTSVCKVFTNEDGAGTSLGVTTGCDHEDGAITCYCCPN